MRCSWVATVAVLAAVVGGSGAWGAPKPGQGGSLGDNPNAAAGRPAPPKGSNLNAIGSHPDLPQPARPSPKARQPVGDVANPLKGNSPPPGPAAPPPKAKPGQARTQPPQNPSDRNRDGKHDDRERRHNDRDGRHPPARRYAYVPYYGYGDYYPYAYPGWYSGGQGNWPEDMTPYMGLEDGEEPPVDRGEAWRPDPPEPKAVNRMSNARSKEMALKFIGYGDAQFAKKKYAAANERYRSAAKAAPQLGEPLFRQAFALAAVGRYDLAAAAVKRGLKLDPTWPKSGFKLDQLLGADEASKRALLDALDKAVAAKPADADRLFVLGVHLYFDGQDERATTLFERAEKIAGDKVGHIEAFLERE
jgi:hypothetical protein